MNNDTSKNNSANAVAPQEKKGTKPWIHSILLIIIIFGALGGFLFWLTIKGTVSIDNSYLEAPIANISVTAPGALSAIYVKEGDRVEPNTEIAVVGSETLYSKDEGIVATAPKVVGSYYAPGQTVVSIVADKQMRVVGAIDENKGLDQIVVGQPAVFTVDAFPGRSYQGVVDEISAVSEETGVAFSISDKRPTRKFDVYLRFDVTQYPELKSGMSAKITIKTNNS